MQTFPHTPETLSGLLLLADRAQERGEDCQRKLAVGWAERTRRHGAGRPRASTVPEIVPLQVLEARCWESLCHSAGDAQMQER